MKESGKEKKSCQLESRSLHNHTINAKKERNVVFLVMLISLQNVFCDQECFAGYDLVWIWSLSEPLFG